MRVRRLTAVGWILALCGGVPAHADAPVALDQVWIIPVTGVVDPFLAAHVTRSLREADASAGGVAACVLTLDTPGGLDTSMRSIIEAMLAARTPVIVFVSPDGGRAASAGAFIACAAPVLAMAPATSIGAAHPVDMQGRFASEKVTNDAASYLRGLALRRGRPVGWADSTVRASLSVSAPDARARGVADVIAANIDDLCAQLDGRTVVTAAGTRTLRLRAGGRETIAMPWTERLLHSIANPNVAYVLFLLGLYGLILEFATPGINFAGIAGVVCLVLALVAFAALEATIGGLVLLGVAGVLFALDVSAPTHGVLTTGGLLALLAGSLLLFRPGVVDVRLSLWVVFGAVATTAAVMLVALRAGVRAQRRPPVFDTRAVVGQRGRAVTALTPGGVVYAAGENWSAVAEAPGIAPGEPVDVTDLTGMTLRVRAVRREKEESA